MTRNDEAIYETVKREHNWDPERGEPPRDHPMAVACIRSDTLTEIRTPLCRTSLSRAGSEAAISPVFSPVLPVVAAVFAAIVSSVDSVGNDDCATDGRYGAAPASGCEWHGQTPSFASASIAASTA